MHSAETRASHASQYRVCAAAGFLTAVFLVIYLPDVGHGFISDDFRWIEEGRLGAARDLVALFGTNIGFYRPVVSASFAADYAVWGSNALGYGLTNLVLCLIAAAALFALARCLALTAAAALLATGVWLFNFHAVNMAVLWLSGRTAILACVFALATAHAVIRDRPVLAAFACLVAMLSKEEAVVLPALFATFLWIVGSRSPIPDPRSERRIPARQRLAAAVVRTLPLWLALGVYVVLRLQSGAFWPVDAPSYYRFSFSPVVVGRNVLEYADRAGTVAVAVSLACLGALRFRRFELTEVERRVLILAALWVVSMYALTVFLPVRSSLYALLPSIGTALAAGAVASAAARVRPAAFTKLGTALLVATVLLIPVYRARNVRWVRVAELSEHVMTTLEREARNHSSAAHVLLIDAPEERFNLAAAFGALLPNALRLRVGDNWTGELVSASPEGRPDADFTFRLSNGRLVPLDYGVDTP